MELCVYESLPSTNRTAYEAAREGAQEFYTVATAELNLPRISHNE